MKPLLMSALFPESDPSELAALTRELGYAGVDLAVHGAPRSEAERTLALLAAGDAPACLLTLDCSDPADVRTWAEVAASSGCTAVRTEPWPPEEDHAADRMAQLAAVAAETGVTVLVPNHAGSRFGDPADLAAVLEGVDPGQVAGLLAPDQVPRSRAGDHAEWLARLRLPSLGAVAVANYRWDSEVGSGNIRLWSPRLATIYHGLTPWPAWLARLREAGFDGLFTFGDPSLSATVGERLRTVRDDLRFVRRVLQA